MGKKQGKSGGLFDSFDELDVDEEKHLKVEEEGERPAKMVREDPSKERSKDYFISRTFEVPDGKYAVRIKAMIKSDDGGVWYTEAQGEKKRVSGYVQGDWEEKDSGWVEGVDVKDGSLSIGFRWCDPAWRGRRPCRLEWVEFYYRKVDG